MFKKLKNKIQVEKEKEQSSTNVSMCSSMSSSRADLVDQQEEQNQKNQVLDSFAALVANDDIEEEDDSEEITVQKFSPPKDLKQINNGNNLMDLNNDNIKNSYFKEQEKVLDDLLIKVENSFNITPNQNDNKLINHQKDSIKTISTNQSNSNENLNNKLNDDSKMIKLDKLYDKINKLENELKEQINQNKKLQDTKHEANMRNNKLFNKLDEMKKQSKLAQDKLNKLKEDNNLLAEKNTELRQMIDNLKENLDFEKEEKLELRNEFNKFKLNIQSKSENNKNEKLIDDLKDKISKLEDQISEKNKTIKLQNQRIHDIKKSVQKGDLFLKDDTTTINKQHSQQQSNGNLDNGYSSRNGSSTKLDEQIVNGKNELIGKLNNNKDYATHVNDINFKYLQNVVLKFITSNDHESQKHLVKAISTLLKFSPEEEQIIKQSLESRPSWFKITENLKF